MLLPMIAQAQAKGSVDKIRTSVTLSGKYSLFIGYLFTCLFLLFGKEFGIFLFHNTDAGMYIYALSWLCPFLYLSTTFTSIINGLGKTQLTFLITVISLLVKIYFLVFLVPRYGIQAYLIGSLLSQITMTVLEAVCLRKYIQWDFLQFVLLPVGILALLGILAKKLYLLLPSMQTDWCSLGVLAILCLFICIGYILILGGLKCIDRREIL
jgi:stage V sporulation protein B